MRTYPNYLKNQRARRLNLNIRKIINGEIKSFWEEPEVFNKKVTALRKKHASTV